MSPPVRVLHVDDEPSFGELVADFLKRKDDQIHVTTVTSAADGIERLTAGDEVFDCIVSDYDMPGKNGLEFLDEVRDQYPDLPFILFTGKGSEEVASEAISAGATDYLQKRGGTEQYDLLANRVRNAVEQHRSTREHDRVYQALETATQGIGLIDDNGEYIYLNEAYTDLYGYDTEDLIGEHWSRLYPVDEVARFEEEILPTLKKEGSWNGRSQGLCHDGSIVVEHVSLTQLDSGGHVCVVQDISDQIEREQELELRNRAIDEAPVGVTITDPSQEDNPIIYANEEFLDTSGYSRAEIIGENHRILQGPKTREEPVTKMREAIDAEEPVNVELRNYRENGEQFWNRVSIAPVYDSEGAVVNYIGFQEEITDRKAHEQELERSEKRFEAMFNDPHILVGVLDIDGTVRDVNDTAMEYIDVRLEDVRGKKVWNTPWFSEEQHPFIKEDLQQAASGEYVTYEANVTTLDGGPYSVYGVIRPVTDDDGQIVSLILSARDMTERKERERLLDVILENTTTPLFMKDRGGEYIFVNEGFRALFELHDKEIIGKTDDDILPPEQADEIRTTDQLVIEQGEPIDTEETIVRNGERRVYLSSKIPVYDLGTRSNPNEPIAVFGVATDITEQKRREEMLERQNERFNELASVISHDLKTPLQTVQGRIELAQETGDISHLEAALDGLDRVAELREDIVEVLRAREVVGEMEAVDVGAIAQSAWETVNTPDKSSFEFRESPSIQADENGVSRLLENLILNSVEHGNGGVSVWVGECDGGFYLADDGKGIAPDIRKEVFTPGFSTKAGGTGVGLTSVQQIVEGHGWVIEITESADGGARFEITGVEISAE